MKLKLSPFLWSNLVLILATGLSLYVASFQKLFVEAWAIPSPDVPVALVLAYFTGVVALVALVLFIIPVSKVRLLFRLLFTLMYAWGVFVIVALVLPTPYVYGVPIGAGTAAIVAGIAWLLLAKVWVHNLLLLLTISAAGSVFGFFFSPWAFMIFMLLVAVYDLLAVRFGFMVWMASKLSESTTLPAFIFPRDLKDWGMSLCAINVSHLAKVEAERREFSILGGGDIGLPLMLVASVFFATDLTSALLVGGFALIGLATAFFIQSIWLKGKPMPALPPIATFSLAGLLVSQAIFG